MANLYRRKGGEILVNTETGGPQLAQSIAALPGGGFVVIWSNAGVVDGGAPDSVIKGQRFDADSNEVDGEFPVNTALDGFQVQSEVAALDNGRFVATWVSQIGPEGDDPGSGIKGQVFNADGTKSGSEFLVNTSAAGLQLTPTITALANGGFVVSWSDPSGLGGDPDLSVKMQIFNSVGAPVGGELLVNTVTAGEQGSPAMAAVASGGFAAVWSGSGKIAFQLFGNSGAKVGSELQVNTVSGGGGADIAPLGSGFIVTWSHRDIDYDPDGFDISAQLLDANGAKIGGEFQVNTTTAGDQTVARVARLPDGSFLVTWQGPGAGSAGMDIHGQVFTAAGAKVGVEFVVNGVTGNAQTVPEIVVLPSGDIVATWTDASGIGGDASGSSVKMQILTLSDGAPTDIALSDTTISETAIENITAAYLSAVNPNGLNSGFTYQLVSDSSGGGFRIEGDRLVVADTDKLDHESAPMVDIRVRATDINGASYEETIAVAIEDQVVETRYSAGDEFQVNVHDIDFHPPVAVTALASGGFLVVTSHWAITVPPGDSSTFRGHIYDAAGNPVGDPFVIGLSDVGGAPPTTAALPTGGFVLVFQSHGRSLGGQLFDAAGNLVGPEFNVSPPTDYGILSDASIAVLDSGNFVVSWTRPVHEDGSDGGPFPSQVMAQLFDPNGTKIGAEFRVNTVIEGEQAFSEAEALPGGGFAVVWQDSGINGIKGQIFDASGAKVGGELIIHAGGEDDGAFNPKLTLLESGNLLVSWTQVIVDGGEDDDLYGAIGQVIDINGVPLGDPMLLAPLPTDIFYDIAALADGGFVLTASVDATDPDGLDSEVLALIFDASGAPVGDPFIVPANTAEGEAAPLVAVNSTGDILLAWVHAYLVDNFYNSDTHARLLTLTSSVAGPINGTPDPDSLTGTSGDDEINGLEGNDVINGLGGADLMRGGLGDDTMFVDNAGDRVIEAAGAGFDRVKASASWTLTAGSHVEMLTTTDNFATNAINLAGNGLSQHIYGNAGGNSFDGGGGDDVMIGLGGNDIYFVRGGDRVVESAGGGFDRIYAFASFTLEAGSAVEMLSTVNNLATSAINLTGNTLSQQLFGNAGSNRLDGGGGGDVMTGLEGDDVYTIRSAADQVLESAGGGDDRVLAASSWALSAGARVETMSTADHAGTPAINLTGNSLSQYIFGNAGANVLDGAGGGDGLVGLGGNDIFYVRSAADRAVEAAGGGSDRLLASISFALEAGSEVEMLTTIDNLATTAINLTGNALGQYLYGNAGANRLDGKAGADVMTGFGGADNFAFTTALGGGNIDRITDFSAADDTILLDDLVFNGLALGALNPNAFVAGTAAADTNDRIIYDQATGRLFFDADGTGAGAAIHFATLDNHAAIAAGDFTVI